MATQNEIRQQITDQIIEALGKGKLFWRRPWSSDPCSGAPSNVVSKKAYSGVNPLILQIAAERHRFTSKFWGTFHQWSEMGFQVMKRPETLAKGSWGSNIIFVKPCHKTSPDAEEESDEDEKKGRSYQMLRSFTVFNADQIVGDGIERFQVGTTPVVVSEIEQRFERAEQVVEATGADIRFGGDRAFYHLAEDYIQMPPKSKFSVPDFWEALLHELSHWTESPNRLNWDRKLPENTYALGELIAELSACYLSNELGLPINETLDNHVAYLQSWLENMKADSRWIFKATSQASRAADFILSFSRVEEPALV
jgi:antirestriction protein ArdC